MKAAITIQGSFASLSLSPAARAALGAAQEADVLVLRDGLLLVAAPGALESLISGRALALTGAANSGAVLTAGSSANVINRVPPAWLPRLSTEEAALLRKLAGVKFEQRTVPSMDRLLPASDKRVLTILMERKLISIFTNPKYPKGVYNLSLIAYAAGAHPQEVKLAQASQTRALQAQTPNLGSSPNPASGDPSIPSSARPPSSVVRATAGDPNNIPTTSSFTPLAPGERALSINTVEHLVASGYMVLDNETDAKRVMPEITQRLKNDDVKGIRGFDKRYYVLRRSFLYEHEGRLLTLLDMAPATPEELAVKLNLTGEAVRVLLMILGDAGEVIEKRKGNWVRA